MAQNERNFGVVQWSSETDERFAAPGEKLRLLKHDLSGKVCHIVGDDGIFKVLKYGENTFRISPEKIVQVSNVKYEVGDEVLYSKGIGKVVDIIWHYAREEPMYFLEINGKKSSRRYFSSELK